MSQTEPMSDREYIAWLAENSKGCIDEHSIAQLIEAVEAGGICCTELTVIVKGARLAVPCSQLPEAWANILHIFCFNDYQLGTTVKIKPGSTIVDIGAYLGFFTIRAAQLVNRQGLFIVVEPNHHARSILYRNLQFNQLQSVARVDPRAVSICDGCLARLYVPPYWANASLETSYLKQLGWSSPSYIISTRTVRLATLLREHGLSQIDLMKIDVEGHEEKIIQDAAKMGILNPELIKQIVVEVHGRKIAEKIEAILANSDYETHIISLSQYNSLQEIVIAMPK
ncbi:FkbM family methyltransferase [Hyperthermus butylicus]|uniref:Universally conserved protein n=1 Tax=Hyperthermus butylicus (strain DSM 5456 / JCM 9403 / PLM1-5) TaxID=415426 RepID=A2BL41_HYPBU|nr:FkbM family methyltransferase [Hyperthermus butylicus]ABM80702.1 universally conserved protein [Hyperthermus butylicus DSM 5456]